MAWWSRQNDGERGFLVLEMELINLFRVWWNLSPLSNFSFSSAGKVEKNRIWSFTVVMTRRRESGGRKPSASSFKHDFFQFSPSIKKWNLILDDRFHHILNEFVIYRYLSSEVLSLEQKLGGVSLYRGYPFSTSFIFKVNLKMTVLSHRPKMSL